MNEHVHQSETLEILTWEGRGKEVQKIIWRRWKKTGLAVTVQEGATRFVLGHGHIAVDIVRVTDESIGDGFWKWFHLSEILDEYELGWSKYDEWMNYIDAQVIPSEDREEYENWNHQGPIVDSQERKLLT